MECPTCQRSITIPECGVNAIPQNLHLGFEVEVAGYMSKIGSDGEKSCDACIDGCTGPAEVKDHGNDTYTITLTPQTAGHHQLLITMDGQHIQNSPCDLHVGREYSTLCNPEQVINCSGETSM